jgi:Zn-dependent peptidase ImmA (M78 family)
VSTLKALLKNLDRLGITRDFALNRLLPKSILAANHSSPDVIEKAAYIISKIYSWSASSILEGRTLSFDTGALGNVRFKKYGRRNEIRATAYTLYAHWLVIQAVEATPRMKTKTIPSDAKKIREQIENRYGELNFSTLLNFVWDSGIVVLPLSDPGAFHGACWRIGDRIAIVVKQGTPYQGRWLFDLAHELAHVIKHLSTEHPTIIETEEITPHPETDDEVEASDFAEELILKGRAEALAQLCVERAKNDLPKLKIAVQEIANEEDVPVDVLANYLAYRLSAQGENWWGTANNLQVDTPSPLKNARQELRARFQPFRLNSEDRTILLQALEDR